MHMSSWLVLPSVIFHVSWALIFHRQDFMMGGSYVGMEESILNMDSRVASDHNKTRMRMVRIEFSPTMALTYINRTACYTFNNCRHLPGLLQEYRRKSNFMELVGVVVVVHSLGQRSCFFREGTEVFAYEIQWLNYLFLQIIVLPCYREQKFSHFGWRNNRMAVKGGTRFLSLSQRLFD